MVYARMSTATLALSFFALSGCTAFAEKSSPLRDEGNWMGAVDYFATDTLRKKFEPELRDEKLPHLGVALAGGGTKASAFSMGVLQGLTSSGLMAEVDALSSVSGGGYAALWYYARMRFDLPPAEAGSHAPQQMARFFADCLPSRYVRAGINDLRLEDCDPINLTNDTPVSDDRYRYQNALRGFQDVFNDSFSYTTTETDTRFSADALVMGLESVAVMPLGMLVNGVFDWELEVSVSQHRYNSGIARAYAASPVKCSDGGCEMHDRIGKRPVQIRREGRTRQGIGLTFADLDNAYQRHGAPLWIINATAGEDRTPWDFSAQSDANLSVFEITPYTQGSGLYGYHQKQLPDLSPYRATVASAAFLDSQQKAVTQPPLRNLLGALMGATTLSWGTSYRNTLSTSANANTQAHYIGHKFLPWPLYYAHRFTPSRDSVFIHLSDGGQSENLGAYALIRRGIETIIISDHAQDRKGEMGDLCRLKSQIRKQGLYLTVPGLADLDSVCNQTRHYPLGYDIFNWQHPVLLGCVSNGKMAEDCSRSEEKTILPGEYFARLFIIKPALANSQLTDALTAMGADCQRGLEGRCAATIMRHCKKFDRASGWNYADAPSCELLGFIAKNFTSADGIASDGCPFFPQHATVMMTADSSPWVYGAMRDLGAYYAQRINWFFSKADPQQVDGQRFNQVAKAQKATPIQPTDLILSRIYSKKTDIMKCVHPQRLRSVAID